MIYSGLLHPGAVRKSKRKEARSEFVDCSHSQNWWIATHLILPTSTPREREYSDPTISFFTDIDAKLSIILDSKIHGQN